MEPAQNKNFSFDPAFDSKFLWELYQNDYQTIESIIKVFLEHFDDDLGAITGAFQKNAAPDMLKSLHKFKPTFGFLGLPQIQEKCREYEELCKKNADLRTDQTVYNDLIAAVLNSKELLEKTYLQLKEFNTRFL